MENNKSNSNKISLLYQRDMIKAMQEFLTAVKNEEPVEMAKALSKFISINKIMGYEMALFNDISVADEFEPNSKTK